MAFSALETVQDYISDVRTLIQDTVVPYRYDDTSLISAFNVTMLEARRLRADLFVYKHHENVPRYYSVDDTSVDIEPPFRLALVFGTGSHALTRDQEDVQDARANTFRDTMYYMLIGTKPRPPISGGSPPPQQQSSGGHK